MRSAWRTLPYLLAGGVTWYAGVSVVDLIVEGKGAHAEVAETGLFVSAAAPLGFFVLGLLAYALGRSVYNNQINKLPKDSGHH